MSEAEVSSPGSDSGKSPVSKLDILSREDLVKFIKKQTVTLQKTRSQCESLKKEVAQLNTSQAENSSFKDNGEIKELQEQVQKLLEEKEQLQATHNSLQATIVDIEKQHEAACEEKSNLNEEVSLLQKEKKALQEQNECLKMKDETLSSSFHFMQEEQDKIISENKSLKEQINVLISARDESLKALKDLKEHHTAEFSELQSQLEESKLQCEHFEERAKVAESDSQESLSVEEKMLKLQENLKDKDELNYKLKALAVKGKKQYEEMKIQVEKINEEKKALEEQLLVAKENLSHLENQNIESGIMSTNYKISSLEHLQEEYDKLHDILEAEQKKSTNFQKDLQQSVQDLLELKENYGELKNEKEKINRQVEVTSLENKSMESQLNELNQKLKNTEMDKETLKLQKDELTKEKNEFTLKYQELEKIVEEKTNLLQAQTEELNSAKKEANQSSMMDLEIADYERTVNSLQVQLSNKDEKIAELQNEVTHYEERTKTLQKEIDTIDEQRVQIEDRSNKLKQLLMKSKKDLADAKRLENEQKTSEAQLRGQMEHLIQQVEDCKMQMSEMGVENNNLQDRLKNMLDSQQRSSKSQEKRILSLQQQLEQTQDELSSVQNEYEGYKVRVHSVLKQQKNKSAQDTVIVEKQEKEHLEKIIDQLKLKLQETSVNLTTSMQENETLQEEHDRLLQRQNKLLQDFQDKENTFKQELEELAKQNTVKNAEYAEAIRQLTLQNESLTLQFKDQLKNLKEDHRKTLDVLHQQVDMAEKENYRLQRELQQPQYSSAVVQRSNKSVERDPTDSPSSDLPLDIARNEERQQGEVKIGMEYVDSESCHRVSNIQGVSSLVTFEQLLTQTEEEVTKSVLNEEELKFDLDSAQKRSDHLAKLLNESEATVMRLTEQAKILKEEIRRLERNQEREKEAANMEYLKNIFLKFVMLKAGDERQMLIPVLCTMLKLSPEEKLKLTAIAQGDDTASGNQAASWGSYLHRWSGLT